MEELQEVKVRLGQIKAHDGNYKQHPADQVVGLQNSLGFFGYVRKVVIQANDAIGSEHLQGTMVMGDHTFTAVAGHGVLQAMRMEKQPEEWITATLIPYDWPEWKVMAYMVQDNESTKQGKADRKLLARLVDTVVKDAPEPQQLPLGMSMDRLDELLALAARQEKQGQAAVPAPAGPSQEELKAMLFQKWQVSPGDVWGLGDHVVVVAAVEEQLAWDALLQRLGLAHGIFTSPPYAEQRKNQYGGKDPAAWVAWMDWVIQQRIHYYLAPAGHLFLNVRAHAEGGRRLTYDKRLIIFLEDAEAERGPWWLVDDLIWLKTPWPGSFTNRLKNGYELIYHLQRVDALGTAVNSLQQLGEARRGKVDGRGYRMSRKPLASAQGQNDAWGVEADPDVIMPSNVLHLAHDSTGVPGDDHPARFPVALPAFFMKGWGLAKKRPDPWIDPFLGSGSTLMAGEELGIPVGGIERDPWYATIVLERWHLATGCDPELLDRLDV